MASYSAAGSSTSGDNNMEQLDDDYIDFNDLIQGIEEIKHCVMEQDDAHSAAQQQLRQLEREIEKNCTKANKLKEKNRETQKSLDAIICQNTELKQQIARENALLLAAEQKRDAVQRAIDKERAQYELRVQEHEAYMADIGNNMRTAPKTYSREKMIESIKQDTETLNELETKKLAMEETNQKLRDNIKALENDEELLSLGQQVDNLLSSIDGHKKATKNMRRLLEEAKEKLSLQQKLKKELLAQIKNN